MHLFIASLCFNLLVAIVVFFVFGGRSLLARPAVQVEPAEAGDTAGGSANGKRLTYPQVLTLVGLVALGVGVLVFGLNVGLVAITIAVVLTILFPKDQARAVVVAFAPLVAWAVLVLPGS